jgi:hypothetical protein
MPLPPDVVRVFGAVAAIVAFVLYVVVTGLGIWFSWNTGDPEWLTSEGTIFWVTGLSALVGGVTAVGLGVKPTDEETDDETPALRGLATVVSGKSQWSTQIWIAIVYAGGYLCLGFSPGLRGRLSKATRLTPCGRSQVLLLGCSLR